MPNTREQNRTEKSATQCESKSRRAATSTAPRTHAHRVETWTKFLHKQKKSFVTLICITKLFFFHQFVVVICFMFDNVWCKTIQSKLLLFKQLLCRILLPVWKRLPSRKQSSRSATYYFKISNQPDRGCHFGKNIFLMSQSLICTPIPRENKPQNRITIFLSKYF